MAWIQPRSIAARLTLLFVLSTTALLALTAGAHYLTLKGSLDARDHATIGSKLNVLRLLLREEQERTEMLVNEVEHEAAADQPMRYFLRVLDAADHAIVETTSMGSLLPVSVFRSADSETRRHSLRDGTRERVFLLRTARAVAPNASPPERTLHVALEVTSHEDLLVFHRERMLAVLGVGTLLAAVLGVLLARDAMRPLGAIALALRRITARRLDERLAATRWPRELSDVAQSCDQMLDRLEESFTRLSQFSADLAHELRTPIGNLRGEAEVALSRARSAEEYQHVLASSLEEYERLARLIDGLLFLARAENPDMAVNRTRLDARREIDAVREFFEALAAERKVQVICAGSGQLWGDPLLFRRAVSNLLSNALQHTPPDGRIEINAHTHADGASEVIVRDSGVGIPAEHLPRIFDRFYRVDRARTQAGHGAGLGLALVQSIMRLHGGAATIDSTVGKGTAVTLHFPPVAAAPNHAQVAGM